MVKNIFILTFMCCSLSAVAGDVNVEQEPRRIVAVNHDDLPKSDYIGTRQIYKKYGFKANFNFILTPFTSASQEASMIKNVKKMLEDGNHLGLHSVMGGTFWWMNKMYDVRPDGTFTFTPSLDEIKTVTANDKNEFGYDVPGRTISQMGFVTLPIDIKDTKLSDLTDVDFRKVLANYSFYFNKEIVEGRDLDGSWKEWLMIQWLEYWYNELIDNTLGYSTISESVDNQFKADYKVPVGATLVDYYPDASHLEKGKIVFFDDTENPNYNNPAYQKVGYFKHGLFKGCASTCNYEVADRCIDIAKAFCKYYFGIDVFTNYGRHGVRYVNFTWSDQNGYYFDNREKTILSGEVGRFYHSRTNRFLTGNDLLLEKGIKMMTGPTSPRNPFIESQVGLYYGQSQIRYPYFNSSMVRNYLDLIGAKSSYSSSLIDEKIFWSFVEDNDNLIKIFYENAGKQLANYNGEKIFVHNYFKDVIDHIRSCYGTGKIPSMSFDTIRDDLSVLMAVELMCQFCKLNNLTIVPLETARLEAVSHQRKYEDNLFPNPTFDNFLLPIIGGESTSADAYLPDGWEITSVKTGDYSFSVQQNGKGNVFDISNLSGSSLSLGTKIYGLPAGSYELSFYAKGDATIQLFLKKNGDFINQYYNDTKQFSPIEQINTTSEYNKYTIHFDIPEPTKNDYNYDGSIINQFAMGYESNITNVRFSVSLGGNKEVSLYGIELKATTEIDYNETDLSVPCYSGFSHVTLGRSLSKDCWNTFCLPFSLGKDQISKTVLADASIKSVSKIEDYNVYFEDASDIIAGIPYLIKPKDNIVNPHFDGVTFSTSEGISVGNEHIQFTGLLCQKDYNELGSNPAYLAVDNSIKQLESDHYNGMRAYFNIVDPSLAHVFIDNTELDIKSIKYNKSTTKAPIYNLMGQQVKPLKKGLYIDNRKKRIIR